MSLTGMSFYQGLNLIEKEVEKQAAIHHNQQGGQPSPQNQYGQPQGGYPGQQQQQGGYPGQQGGYPGQQQQEYQQQQPQQYQQHPPQYAPQYAPPGAPGGGKHRSLFIGINYIGQQAELKGCHEDVKNVQAWVHKRFPNSETATLMDVPGCPPDRLPTKANIMRACQWLVSDAQPGDHFFIHYSGHGGRQADNDGDDKDGFDETIVPLDFQQAGQITDDDLHKTLCAPLPAGANLLAIFDSCHSGTVLDLPFVYIIGADGNVVEIDNRSEAAKAFLRSGMEYFKGNKKDAIKDAMQGAQFLFKHFQQQRGQGGGGGQQQQQQQQEGLSEMGTKVTKGFCVQWSGCADTQTSADAHINGRPSGALSWGFIKATESLPPNSTYVEVLRETRRLLKEGGYEQIPQLSCGDRLDLNVPLVI
ncbi:Ca(2+)-dependent cysteine protease [Irineochytrium annulatum]|nr:Ca(2+)-dependent cysteine protease [Irineochytrium annulatum]